MLRRLPGFGEYMSAAVASLAFGARVPAVDANVTRVVSRIFAIDGETGTLPHGKAVRRRAAALLPADRPGDLTAALMDLGQQICLPRRPDCPACPVSRFCAALRNGHPERFPRRRARPPARHVHLAAAVAESGGRLLLVRETRPLLRGLWLFPSADAPSAAEARGHLARALAALGLRLSTSTPIGSSRHTIVNRRLDIRVYGAVSLSGGARERQPAARTNTETRWLSPESLDRAAIPTLTRRIAEAARGPRRRR